MTNDYVREVLTVSRANFFSDLGWTREAGFYLAGGTALAIQIGHRTSVDFDFYTQHHFQSGSLARLVYRALDDRWEIEITRDLDDTFDLTTKPDIHLSCFYYEYPLLCPARVIMGVSVASLQDIAAMKILAISQRGRHRDFVDLYYLLGHFTVEEMIRPCLEKYPMYDPTFFLRSVLYFEDAEKDKDIGRIKLFDRSLTWKKIKQTITEKVREYQLKGSR